MARSFSACVCFGAEREKNWAGVETCRFRTAMMTSSANWLFLRMGYRRIAARVAAMPARKESVISMGNYLHVECRALSPESHEMPSPQPELTRVAGFLHSLCFNPHSMPIPPSSLDYVDANGIFLVKF